MHSYFIYVPIPCFFDAIVEYFFVDPFDFQFLKLYNISICYSAQLVFLSRSTVENYFFTMFMNRFKIELPYQQVLSGFDTNIRWLVCRRQTTEMFEGYANQHRLCQTH